ncbi:MAG: YqgE/AlgH family protein [Deltaproteobacteria bacterium]|nr:YqgE/AlgH family protein [Deltaproteobacteria bacterium]MBW2627241.1 YqgE/AlgH family protein [Deltaproteobacteria bacterium]MBW2685350.1 YqgE/AlgH family protein [Deltaproteobacteria bacterium]
MRKTTRTWLIFGPPDFGLARLWIWWQSRLVAASLAPGFIVAAPSMRCPFFNHTLVLLIDHGDEGSFGFVLNRMTDLDIEDVFKEVGVSGEAATSVRAPVMLGGPVSPESGWILYDPEGVPQPSSGQTIAVGQRIACSASIELLERIARGDGPDTCAMMLGYAGWGEGQLESEMKQGSWIPVDLEYDLVFDTPIEDRWEAALATLGIDPARLIDNQIASA